MGEAGGGGEGTVEKRVLKSSAAIPSIHSIKMINCRKRIAIFPLPDGDGRIANIFLQCNCDPMLRGAHLAELNEVGDHDNRVDPLLPDHAPEGCASASQRSLRTKDNLTLRGQPKSRRPCARRLRGCALTVPAPQRQFNS